VRSPRELSVHFGPAAPVCDVSLELTQFGYEVFRKKWAVLLL
jgi:hypothetical protein